MDEEHAETPIESNSEVESELELELSEEDVGLEPIPEEDVIDDGTKTNPKSQNDSGSDSNSDHEDTVTFKFYVCT